MAAAAILDFWNFKFLTVGTFKRFEMHHVAKFHQNRLNCGRDTATFRFFKMAAAAILNLASLLKTLKSDKMSPGRFSFYMYQTSIISIKKILYSKTTSSPDMGFGCRTTCFRQTLHVSECNRKTGVSDVAFCRVTVPWWCNRLSKYFGQTLILSERNR